MEEEERGSVPDPLLAIRGANSRVSSTVAFTFRSRVSERFSKGESIKGPLTAHPALFTNTSTWMFSRQSKVDTDTQTNNIK